MTLHINSFGGGVVLAGAPDTRKTDELLAADSVDIGARGALICASDVTDYVTLRDDANAPFARLYALLSVAGFNFARVVGVGEGDFGGDPSYIWNIFDREGATSPVAVGGVFGDLTTPPIPVPQGVIVTGCAFAGVYQVKFASAAVQDFTLYLVNLGAREGFAPNTAPGLYVFATIPPDTTPVANPIQDFDALGTGPAGPNHVAGGGVGTHSVQLKPRGVIAFNGHVFIYGFDNHDAVNGDGANRVMFCNIENPLVWGNDNVNMTALADRVFTDSDAIVLGDAGEIIRSAIKWNTKLWFGTNQQLHYIGGYGRDSFLTDGATPVAKAYNVIGPGALIEGPDRKLYGICDQGLWATADGVLFTPLFERLRDFEGHSNGFMDCIWHDPSNANAYPGLTNADLVWMGVDWFRQQIIIGIPFCDTLNGGGVGADTLVVKWNVRTGGFTRQKFPGVQYTCAGYFRAEFRQPAVQYFGTVSAEQVTVKTFGRAGTDGSSPIIARSLPMVTAGPFSPFGPDGEGSLRQLFATLAWEQSPNALPLTFRFTIRSDNNQSDTFAVYLRTTKPLGVGENDFWLDMSQSNMSIGNGTAGVGIPARHGYLMRQRRNGQWDILGGQGEAGTRVTLRLPLNRVVATRYEIDWICLEAHGRFQLEGLGLNPGDGEPAAGGG